MIMITDPREALAWLWVASGLVLLCGAKVGAELGWWELTRLWVTGLAVAPGPALVAVLVGLRSVEWFASYRERKGSRSVGFRGVEER